MREGESEKILGERETGARAKRKSSVSKTGVKSFFFLFVLSFFSLRFFLLLTCSRQRARALEYILGGRSELEGAERKRAILALRAGGDDDEDFFADPKLVDFGFDAGDVCEGMPLLAPAAPTCARTRVKETRELLCVAPLELRWAAIGAFGPRESFRGWCNVTEKKRFRLFRFLTTKK